MKKRQKCRGNKYDVAKSYLIRLVYYLSNSISFQVFVFIDTTLSRVKKRK